MSGSVGLHSKTAAPYLEVVQESFRLVSHPRNGTANLVTELGQHVVHKLGDDGHSLLQLGLEEHPHLVHHAHHELLNARGDQRRVVRVVHKLDQITQL